MGKKEIHERSIEIAKFQGAKLVQEDGWDDLIDYPGGHAYEIGDLEFSSNFDWSMPLIKTIQNKIKKGNSKSPLLDTFKIYWNADNNQYEVTLSNALSSDPKYRYEAANKSEKLAIFTVISDVARAFNEGSLSRTGNF